MVSATEVPQKVSLDPTGYQRLESLNKLIIACCSGPLQMPMLKLTLNLFDTQLLIAKASPEALPGSGAVILRQG